MGRSKENKQTEKQHATYKLHKAVLVIQGEYLVASLFQSVVDNSANWTIRQTSRNEHGNA